MTPLGGQAVSRLARAGRAVAGRLTSVFTPGAAGAQTSRTRSGWLVLTVFRPLEETATADIQDALGELGRSVDVRLTTAPDGAGTEVAARFRTAADPAAGDDGAVGVDALRASLRRIKQVLEVGEVLVLEPVPHGHRSATPAGALLDAATSRADEKGVL